MVAVWLALIVVVGAAANSKREVAPTVHWWIHDVIAAREACGNINEWTTILADLIAIHQQPTVETKTADRRRRRRVQTNKYCWMSGDPTKCPPGHGLVAARPSPAALASPPALSPSTTTNSTNNTGNGGAVRRRRRHRRVQTNKYCWMSGDPTKCPPGHGGRAAPPPMPAATLALPPAPSPSLSNSTNSGHAIRRRVESSFEAEDDACEPVQRAAYAAIQEESSLTHTCRDYIVRHAPEWICQFD
jgi:hypothetical protein